MTTPRIAVEVANHRFARRAFRDLPVGLHGNDPAWVPRLQDDPSRVNPKLDPWFDDQEGQAAFLLARIAGRSMPVARCSAHFVEGSADGFFGLLDTVDDGEIGSAAVVSLLRWAMRMLREHGCTSITGPVSYRLDQEAGVAPRDPAWLGPALEAAGLARAAAVPSYRLEPVPGPELPTAKKLVKRLPKRLRAYADDRLLLADSAVGRILAVPEVRADSSWALAQRAAKRDWDTAVVVEVSGPPEVLVPALLSAAAAAGYATVVSPWAPPGVAADFVARLYRADL